MAGEPVKPLLLVPLAFVLVVALPLASAHPACNLVDNGTEMRCAPILGPFQVACDATTAALAEGGDRVAEECEDRL